MGARLAGVICLTISNLQRPHGPGGGHRAAALCGEAGGRRLGRRGGGAARRHRGHHLAGCAAVDNVDTGCILSRHLLSSLYSALGQECNDKGNSISATMTSRNPAALVVRADCSRCSACSDALLADLCSISQPTFCSRTRRLPPVQCLEGRLSGGLGHAAGRGPAGAGLRHPAALVAVPRRAAGGAGHHPGKVQYQRHQRQV